jgi:hypothetical protein
MALKPVDTYYQQSPSMPHQLMDLVAQRIEDPAMVCAEEYGSHCYSLIRK